jgi:uncharacterized membrane protein
VELLDIVSRIIHVATAITLVGGTIFTLFVLLPSSKLLSTDAHDVLAAEIKGRWKRFVHIGILLFLVSGFYNYFRAMGIHRGDGLYHGLVGAKILLAFAMFFIAAALVGRSAKLQPMRDNRAWWLKVMVLIAAVIVVISGYVKVRGSQAIPKPVSAMKQVVSSPLLVIVD